MDRYTARMTLRGTTTRERMINETKEKLTNSVADSLSFKKVNLCDQMYTDTVDSSKWVFPAETERNLIIDSNNSHPYIKEIKSLPGETFEVGNYVIWQNAYWLITEADYDSELYVDGKMQQCNWLLTWQREDGQIARYWCVNGNATQYNSGEATDREAKITYVSSQHKLILPYNEDTVVIDSPQRFFLDRNVKNPSTYIVTQNDTSSDNYGQGLVTIMATQNERNDSVDKYIQLPNGEYTWIADYTSEPVASKTVTATISGRNDLPIGTKRVYTATLSDTTLVFTWNIVSDFSDKISITNSGNTAEIVVTDKSLADKSFTLQIVVSGIVVADTLITIEDVW